MTNGLPTMYLLTWCPDPRMAAPCASTPCRPPVGSGATITVTSGQGMGWNVCVAGDMHDLYFSGDSSGPGSYPYQGNPPFVNPDPTSNGQWPAANPNIDPAVKYGIVTGFQANVPIKVGGVTVGSFGGDAGGGVSTSPDPAFKPYPPPCPNNGVVQVAVKSYPPVVDSNYPTQWLWVETIVNYNQYSAHISFAGGTYNLDPKYTALYQQQGKTDPLLMPGGPQFLITIKP